MFRSFSGFNGAAGCRSSTQNNLSLSPDDAAMHLVTADFFDAHTP
jgi:hypothetical protein